MLFVQKDRNLVLSAEQIQHRHLGILVAFHLIMDSLCPRIPLQPLDRVAQRHARAVLLNSGVLLPLLARIELFVDLNDFLVRQVRHLEERVELILGKDGRSLNVYRIYPNLWK